MNILLWIVFGGIAGWLSSVVMKTNASQGTLTDILLGIVGAVVGGFLMSLLGLSGVTGFNLYSLVVAVIGSIFLVWVGRLVQRSSI